MQQKIALLVLFLSSWFKDLWSLQQKYGLLRPTSLLNFAKTVQAQLFNFWFIVFSNKTIDY